MLRYCLEYINRITCIYEERLLTVYNKLFIETGEHPKACFFYSQTCLWLKTTRNTFKSLTINLFKIDKKRNG